MHKAELADLIRNRENSGVEFKRDDIEMNKLAVEIVGLLNLSGGHVLLGVEDDGTVTGLNRSRGEAEEWVMEAARVHVLPATIPYWETIEWGGGKLVGIVSVPENAPDKPYKVKRGPEWVTKVRVGSTTRSATREEEERLYQQSGRLRYGLKPVVGAGLNDLDSRRLRQYLVTILEGTAVPQGESEDEWPTLLTNLELARLSAGQTIPTVDAVLLFGKGPKRLLPQSGIRAVCFLGEEPDYATRADEDLRAPLVPLRGSDGSLVEPGLVDQAWDFVRRNTTPRSSIRELRRVDRWEYPEVVVREAVLNALVHRDYSIAGTDIMLTIYSDRLEVQSPGRLPNTVTVDGMKSGVRYARNQTLVNVMRDYGYVDARGMGVRNKVIPGMHAHNGTEPDLIEEEHRFTVRLWKEAQPS